MKILIKNAKIIDPTSSHHGKRMDILVVDGSISKIATELTESDAIEVVSNDLHVSMGWVDLKADFCDPGMEHKETIQSGLDAASMGGYTHVHVVPGTQPSIDGKTQIAYLYQKAEGHSTSIHALGALTKGLKGEELAELDEKIVVKIPMIKDGIKALKYFSDRGIKTNCTLVFSAGQALLAAKAGATYVSPFVGRLDDISTNGLDLISQIRLIYDNYAFDTQILAASVRHPMHIINCAEIGADVMTGPLSAIKALAKHPLTDLGLQQFLADYAKGNQ